MEKQLPAIVDRETGDEILITDGEIQTVSLDDEHEKHNPWHSEIHMTLEDIWKGYVKYNKRYVDCKDGAKRIQEYVVVETPKDERIYVAKSLPDRKSDTVDIYVPVQDGNIAAVGQFFQLACGESRRHLLHPLTYGLDDPELKEAPLYYVDTRIGSLLEQMASNDPTKTLIFKCKKDENGFLVAHAIVTEAYAAVHTDWLVEQFYNALADSGCQFQITQDIQSNRGRWVQCQMTNHPSMILNEITGNPLHNLTIQFASSDVGKEGIKLTGGILILACSNGLVIWDQKTQWSRKHVKSKNSADAWKGIAAEFKVGVKQILADLVRIADEKITQARTLQINRDEALEALRPVLKSEVLVEQVKKAWDNPASGVGQVLDAHGMPIDTVYDLVMALSYLPQMLEVTQKGSRKKDDYKLSEQRVLFIQDRAGRILTEPKQHLPELFVTVPV
jgi:hypothetical protein